MRTRTTGIPTGFAKLSLTVEADLAQKLREAAVADHRVSASALVAIALCRFLAPPAAEPTSALKGIGRRRRPLPARPGDELGNGRPERNDPSMAIAEPVLYPYRFSRAQYYAITDQLNPPLR